MTFNRTVPVLALALMCAAPANAEDAAPLCTEETRACFEQTVKAYYDGLIVADGAAVPFASDVRVTEQGRVVVTSRADFLKEFKASGLTKGYRNKRYVVDEKAGEIVIFALADVDEGNGKKPYTVRRAQRMKIVKGLIREVELFIHIDDNPAAIWPDR